MADFVTKHPEILECARALFAKHGDARSAAIEAVDGHFGFSMEYAGNPAFHRSLWDDVEERLNANQ